MELGQSVKTGIRRKILGKGPDGPQGLHVDLNREVVKAIGVHPLIKLGNGIGVLTILNVFVNGIR